MIVPFLVGFAGFVPLVIIHLILCRLTGSQKFVVKSLALNLLFLVAASFFIFSQFGLIDLLVIFLTEIILWNSYLIFLINLQNSISFRILFLIHDNAKRSMDYAEIEALYPDQKSFSDRLLSMQLNNLIEISGEDILLLEKGRTMARVFGAFRSLFSIEKFG